MIGAIAQTVVGKEDVVLQHDPELEDAKVGIKSSHTSVSVAAGCHTGCGLQKRPQTLHESCLS